ncbi:pyruvate phosphate dikinase PEP/pyruvate-binding protein [Crinalium epipsammum PCC 9333]|uniref:Pyruvate phosphate dikinase PEP/pyruvate-binding protein n=2 Tax=Crinalium TaxID=241421 RepID=K9VZ16_9CYAN|nr:pyruvate phosphate dikinase PEP/pyruvate-binding protein [Crinalium epipsammum PCC 9333]
MQVWGCLVIWIVCPLLGGLPLIRWVTYALTGRNLAKVGTGNVSVSAAFYHGGKLAGILSVLSEAFKGIAAVLIARYFFPSDSSWELIALIALVMGRYWMGKGAGTTNVTWGMVVHDWKASLLIFIIGGISFTILRDKTSGRYGALILIPLILALLHPHEGARIAFAVILSGLIGWIYKKIPDDLDLRPQEAKSESQTVFRFFRGDRAIVSLDRQLDPNKVGQKAATLSQLKRWGYPVPTGWVLPAGDDPQPLIDYLQPSIEKPLVVRSSAVGEDSEYASAAGQYKTILNVTTTEALQVAIVRCITSYDEPAAVQYRRDRGIPDASMSLLIQQQVPGVFSGVAFSRDPILQHGDAVVIEALPGEANRIVSGQVTPEHYRVIVIPADLETNSNSLDPSWVIPDNLELPVEGNGDVPPRLIQQVAYIARQLEARYLGTPQDIEWSYDGQTLWLLQSRPITTLQPIWTRKIAAEVIPGLIRPLTWSINRPLTCGVWGEIFTLVLNNRADKLDFNQTATLHHSRAYFNASLLGQIFLRMGLPPESLEFLTRGAKFSKPPLSATLKSTPGLIRLLRRELKLEADFKRDYERYFAPTLSKLSNQPASELSPVALLERIEMILEVLKRGTYYSIMAPLSAALRQAVWKVKDEELDNSQTPEVASMRSLQELANDARHLLPTRERTSEGSFLFATLAEIPDGESILERFDQWLNQYGYLSEVGTDIAVPTWKEDPRPVRELFAQFLATGKIAENEPQKGRKNQDWKVQLVQKRFSLKGKVTEIYSHLLAQLRWCFVQLERLWIESGLLSEEGDIFFLKLAEISILIAGADLELADGISELVRRRRSQLEQDNQITNIPALIYGNTPSVAAFNTSNQQARNKLQGIGASPGQVEGKIKVLQNFQVLADIDRETIIVVPYTDSGWAPILARAGGLIAEVGGRLSHGAIVAREYGIPAVMDVHNATQFLQDGQRVRIDGATGIVEVL